MTITLFLTKIVTEYKLMNTGGIEKEKWYICPDGEQTGYKYELINSNDTMQFLKGDIQIGRAHV